jgi:hypothetical protein
VPEIVLQAVSAVLNDVVVLILYLPAGPSAVHRQPDILPADQFVRYPDVFVDNLVFLPVIRFKIKAALLLTLYADFRPTFSGN